MRCRVCGGQQERRVTDLPFKVTDHSIVIVKALQFCNAVSAANRNSKMR